MAKDIHADLLRKNFQGTKHIEKMQRVGLSRLSGALNSLEPCC